MNKDIVVLIPCYNPNEKIMLNFIDELKKQFKNIIFINDGSNKTHQDMFNNLAKSYPVLKHYKNYGKGRGLKNGLNYILNNYPNVKAIVTADCDGQHSVKDIKRCAEETLKNQNSLILGVRDFDKKNVPLQSELGNKITRNIFRTFIGLKITDTQTGLRGMSKVVATKLVDILGERYEYETNVLIACKEKNIKIKEIVIETIYINDNATSHFDPIEDSIKIYKLFSRFIFSRLGMYIVEILIFILLYYLLLRNHLILSLLISSLISIIFYKLFIKNEKVNVVDFFSIIGSLIIVNLCSVYMNVILLKFIVDFIIFVLSFIFYNMFVFKSDD